MPMSRARTAICSAPLECPSSPGLPTRIFGVRPIASPTRATSSRSSATSSVGAGGGDRRLHHVLVAPGHAAQLLERGVDGLLVAARAPFPQSVDRLLLDRG